VRVGLCFPLPLPAGVMLVSKLETGRAPKGGSCPVLDDWDDCHFGGRRPCFVCSVHADECDSREGWMQGSACALEVHEIRRKSR
jgi:hypothetical protein